MRSETFPLRFAETETFQHRLVQQDTRGRRLDNPLMDSSTIDRVRQVNRRKFPQRRYGYVKVSCHCPHETHCLLVFIENLFQTRVRFVEEREHNVLQGVIVTTYLTSQVLK